MALENVKVPDLGGSSQVDVIDVLVKVGDSIQKETSIVTLEGDKASMEVPAPFAGIVKEIKVKVGDKVSENSLLLVVETQEQAQSEKITARAEATAKMVAPAIEVETKQIAPMQEIKNVERVNDEAAALEKPLSAGEDVHAGPAVRRLAREFGVELARVQGTGEKGRIIKQDLQNYVKSALVNKGSGIGLAVAAMPKIDFSKYGNIDTIPLSKIKKLTGVNTHRSWVAIPHVTQFDEADITDMEEFRIAKKVEAEKKGVKLTPLVFLMKAVVKCLQMFPNVNASLDQDGENLIVKKYFHIGVAVDTPNGLVVPVIRDVDQKGLYTLSRELAEISKKAREKGLTVNEMSGSCFTISSLGGIGGTAFTPIVNAPDVAILGVSKAQMKPVWNNKEFLPRLMLPLSLSYDHRVIDGAEAARFTTLLAHVLGDIRELLL